ncbi:SanA protein [Andreprevotia lacus DSM 23236]|jgi:SanA protein|uniref:SanA protein n=1 Tax=Andreprevotia lacus DSM 23236 TaxID=1121001 RepID=A0A1W1Y0G3_9NEIS|nr:ElyC/SanA/YdcF family protein [Andreprevotia lacus]SMC29622.1 SanA protein [Andreprevotia lacus DSM 23236]
MAWLRRRRKPLLILLTTALLLTGINLALARHVANAANGRSYADPAQTPARPIGVMLGAPRHTWGGSDNAYYWLRVRATVALFRAGKLGRVIVSDDEPQPMRDDLIRAGIPADKVAVDAGGARTIHSIAALRGAGPVTLISQHFHNERALYMAQHYRVDAIAFDARDVSNYYGILTRLREQVARLRMLAELACSDD